MNGALLFRAAAAAFIALVLALGALQARLPHSSPVAPVQTPPTNTEQEDPLVARQRRCQALGAAGAQDQDCLATWARTRARFLGKGA